jgi:hypothetical protein
VKRTDISKHVTYAILDVKKLKLNAEINKLRKSGKRIHFTMSGYLSDQDHSRYDGVSIEQSADVLHCTIKSVGKAMVKKL